MGRPILLSLFIEAVDGRTSALGKSYLAEMNDSDAKIHTVLIYKIFCKH